MDSHHHVTLEDSDVEVTVTKSYTQLLDHVCQDEYFTWTPNVALSSGCQHQDMGGAEDIWLNHRLDGRLDFEEDLQKASEAMNKMDNARILMDQVGSGAHPDDIFKDNKVVEKPRPPTYVMDPQVSTSHCKEIVQSKNQNGCTMAYMKEGAVICREWLIEHYELIPGVSVPRSAMYNHYLDHCQELGIAPLNPAGFGKAIRATFPTIKTRRLGNRGASKYHYDGISIRKTSPYCSTLSKTQRVSQPIFHSKILPEKWAALAGLCASGGKTMVPDDRDTASTSRGLKRPRDSRKSIKFEDYDQAPILPKILRPFNNKCRTLVIGERIKSLEPLDLKSSLPDPKDVLVSDFYGREVSEFLQKYTVHLMELNDIMGKANLHLVKDKLAIFWSSFSFEMVQFFHRNLLTNVLRYCDMIFYRHAAATIMPNALDRKIPLNIAAIRQFGKQYHIWLQNAIAHLPDAMKEVKMSEAQIFSMVLHRQASLNKVACEVHTTLQNKEYMELLAYHWLHLDYRKMAMETCNHIGYNSGVLYCVKKGLRDTEKFLRQALTLEQYLKAVDESISQCVSSLRSHLSMTEEVAQQQSLSHFQTTVRVVLKELVRSDIAGTVHVVASLINEHLNHSFEKKRQAREEAILKGCVLKMPTSHIIPSFPAIETAMIKTEPGTSHMDLLKSDICSLDTKTSLLTPEMFRAANLADISADEASCSSSCAPAAAASISDSSLSIILVEEKGGIKRARINKDTSCGKYSEEIVIN